MGPINMSYHNRLHKYDLTALLSPQSITVIGASDSPENLGGAAVRLLQKFHFPGPIWPVHPHAAKVAGQICYAAIEQLPAIPDLAIIALSAERVTDTVIQCARAGVRAGIVWAGGFGEAGPDGVARQAQLTQVCRDRNFALLGPNCLGVIDSKLPLTATFTSSLVETDRLLPGNISMVGQSGGLVTMALAAAQRHGAGFRYAVSTGNEAVLSTADFVAQFSQDDATEVIAMYFEGAEDGGGLVRALESARDAGKPVVVLKGGRSKASAVAAQAHTGALAGESRVWDAVLREQAAIRVSSLEELLDVVLALSGRHGRQLPNGDRMAIVTFGGGNGVLSADQCAEVGLTTPTLTDSTTRQMAPLLPATASLHNPIDLTPQTSSTKRVANKLPHGS